MEMMENYYSSPISPCPIPEELLNSSLRQLTLLAVYEVQLQGKARP